MEDLQRILTVNIAQCPCLHCDLTCCSFLLGTYVLDELSVLDLKSFTWSKFHGVPPRYNHSATLVGHKMYIYAGKDEHGNAVACWRIFETAEEHHQYLCGGDTIPGAT